MKNILMTAMLSVFVFAFTCAAQNKQTGDLSRSAVAFERYESYFEKNNSGLKGEKSYLAVGSQKRFDGIFGAAATMDDNNFLPDDAFKSKIIVATIKRGSLRKYEDVKITAEKGKLIVSYKVKDDALSSATFSSPLILAVAQGKYKEVVFMENGKRVGKAKLEN